MSADVALQHHKQVLPVPANGPDRNGDRMSSTHEGFVQESRKAWLKAGLHKRDALGRRLEEAVKRHPDAVVSFLSRSRPYTANSGRMLEDAAQIAASFQAIGLQAGDAVAIQLPNWREGLLSYLACLQA